MALTLGELVGYLRLDDRGWKRGLDKAQRDMGEFTRGADGRLRDARGRFVAEGRAAGDGFSRGLGRGLGRSVGSIGMAVVRMGMLAGASGAVSNALGGLAAGAAAASGSLLLLPAAGMAAAFAFGALKIGTAGFGEALSNMGDPEKFAESLKGLAPAARETAVAIAGLQPRFNTLKTSVQGRLFDGMAQQVSALGNTYLPILDERFGRIADAANGAGRSVALMLTESSRVADVKTIGDASASAFENLARAVGPVAAALLDVGTVGSSFLPGLTDGARNAAISFQQFIATARESGALAQWIQGGLDALSQLGAIAGNVGSILGSVFAAMSASGGGMLASLVQLTGGLAAFLDSAQGATMLGQIFGGLSAAAGGLVPAVLSVATTLIGALAPVIAQLGPAVGQLATQVGSVLVGAIQMLAPLLLQLATFLNENMSWLGPLVIGFVAFSAAIGPTISIVMGLVNAFKAVSLALQVLRVAMFTNPFTAIITAVLLLVVLIVTNWDTIKDYLLAAWEWIKSTAESVWNGIVSFFTDVWDSITSTVSSVWNGIVGFFTGAWDRIVAAHTQALAFVRGLISNVLGNISGIVSNIWSKVTGIFSSAWSSIRDAVSNGVSNVIGFVRGLPGQILGALGNLGNLLYESGKSLLTGLWNGISGAVGWVKDKISGVLGSIRDLFPFSPAKEGPFSGRGYTTYSGRALMGDFGRSIAAAGAGAVDAATGVAARVQSALSPELAAFGAVRSPRLSAPAAVSYAGANSGGLNLSAPITPDVLREALDGMSWTFDERAGRGIARLVNRANALERRR
ncbi:phage tail protein [Saccharopolyspora sp. NPDC002376]